MRRPLVVVAAALAVVVVLVTAAVAVSLGDRRDSGSVPLMHPGMVRTSTTDVRDWPQGRRGWMPGWTHGPVAATEFAYLTEMVAHHQEAVDAAEELRRSERPQMRALGRSIVASQSAQIRQMQAWLAGWYPGRSTDVAYRPMMRELSGLSGDELDRTFLEDMIAHHMMAVMMSQQLLAQGTARHERVNRLAETVRADQLDEILQMQRWLAVWFDLGWFRGMGPEMMW